MPDLSSAYTNYQNSLNNLSQYTPYNPQDVMASLNNRVGNFQPQYNELAKLDAQAYSAPVNSLSQLNDFYGTGANSTINPLSKFTTTFDNLGRSFATRDAVANGLAYGQGNLKDIMGNLGNYYDQGMKYADTMTNNYKDIFGTANSNNQNDLSRRNAIQTANISAGAQNARLQWEKDQAKLNTDNLSKQNFNIENNLQSTLEDNTTNRQVLSDIGAIPIGNGSYKLPLTGKIVKISNPQTNTPSVNGYGGSNPTYAGPPVPGYINDLNNKKTLDTLISAYPWMVKK